MDDNQPLPPPRFLLQRSISRSQPDLRRGSNGWQQDNVLCSISDDDAPSTTAMDGGLTMHPFGMAHEELSGSMGFGPRVRRISNSENTIAIQTGEMRKKLIESGVITADSGQQSYLGVKAPNVPPNSGSQSARFSSTPPHTQSFSASNSPMHNAINAAGISTFEQKTSISTYFSTFKPANWLFRQPMPDSKRDVYRTLVMDKW